MRTLARAAGAEVTISRSRFIARARRVGSEADAREHIAAARRGLGDARHHCAAFVLGPAGHLARSSDDGEPSGTAGAPILAAIRAADLTDTVVVVTRYFGGVKLGTGGLARAYGSCAAEAIARAGLVELRRMDTVEVTGDYAACGGLEAAVRASAAHLVSVEYGQTVRLVVACDDADGFAAWVAAATAGAATTRHSGHTVVEVPV